MNLTTDRAQGVAIVRIGETRLMYPLLADFSGAVMSLLTAGDKKVMIDLSKVTYVDSATIGCLMDLYRQTSAAGGELRLSAEASLVGSEALLWSGGVVVASGVVEPGAIRFACAGGCGPGIYRAVVRRGGRPWIFTNPVVIE